MASNAASYTQGRWLGRQMCPPTVKVQMTPRLPLPDTRVTWRLQPLYNPWSNRVTRCVSRTKGWSSPKWGYSITPHFVPVFQCSNLHTMARVRNWCFTLNNPQEHGIVDDILPALNSERYIVWQRERGANGTVHHQGYVECHAPMRLGAMKEWLPSAHFEPRRGTREQARAYCMKADSRDGESAGPWERGDFDAGEQRVDLQTNPCFHVYHCMCSTTAVVLLQCRRPGQAH